MTITASPQPTADTLREVDALLAACATRDGAAPVWQLHPALNRHPEMNALFIARENGQLAGALAVFAPESDTAELSAAVRPAFRRRGVFTGLLGAACREAARFGHHQLLLPHLAGMEAGAQVASRWMLPLAHSEYAMVLAPQPDAQPPTLPPGVTIGPVELPQLDAASRLSAEAFGDTPEDSRRILEDAAFAPGKSCVIATENGRPVGQYCLNGAGAGAATLYGLAVAPAQRGRGLGRALLQWAIAGANASKGGAPMRLEVDSLNAPAFTLYRSAGFTVEKQVDYYACPAEHFIGAR